MKIFSYFDSSTGWGGQAELIAVWEQSWRRFGWQPQILTPRDATRHPDYARFLAKINTLPTVNSRVYENACYLRWLALDRAGGGFMCDYDVINYGLRPFKPDHGIDFFHPQYIPSFVYFNKEGCRTAFQHIMDYKPEESHVSDMIILMKMGRHLNGGKPVPRLKCCEYADEKFGWLNMPTIHFAAGAVHQKHGNISKVEAIRRCPR